MRFAFVSLAIIGILAAASAGVGAAAAEPDQAVIRETIANTLAAPEFATSRESYEYRYRGKPLWEPDSSSERESARHDPSLLELIVTILARFGQAILWTLLIAAIVLAVIHRKRWLQPLIDRAQPTTAHTRPQIIAGLDVSPASLPDDIGNTALALWLGAEHRAALSLLYRGALSALVTRRGLHVPASATESDCVVNVEKASDPSLAAYFSQLTTAWTTMAYARQEPGDEHVQWLCGQWHRHFDPDE